MGFSTTLVVKPQFQSADDPDIRTKTDQVILRSGLPLLSIDTTISNVCSDQSLKCMKGKPKYLAVASLREQSKINDYTGECRKIGHDFLPAAFECQGSIGQMFAQHFENCVQKRAAEELGMKQGGSHQDRPLRWSCVLAAGWWCLAPAGARRRQRTTPFVDGPLFLLARPLQSEAPHTHQTRHQARVTCLRGRPRVHQLAIMRGCTHAMQMHPRRSPRRTSMRAAVTRAGFHEEAVVRNKVVRGPMWDRCAGQ
jgi:hypothetical protein